METAKIIYEGELRTKATHQTSGVTIVTDAPVDNCGKGETFSPTDLLATSLGSCMITIMGIAAKNHQINIGKIELSVTKKMGSEPRRVIEIDIKMTIQNLGLSDKDKIILERAAITCPVAKSLSSEITQKVEFKYV